MNAPHVLIVEDDLIDKTFLVRALTRSDLHARLTHAGDLATARRVLAHERVDCVLTDLRLPDGQGTELIEETPAAVVVITGDDAHDAAAAIRSGAQDWLQKGQVTPSAVARAVHYACLRVRTGTVERRIRHAERFATVGQLAGALAHELNNPGTVVLAALELLQDRLRERRDLDRKEAAELVDGALQSMTRMARITRGLISYSRLHVDEELGAFEVDHVLATAADIVGNAVRAKARLAIGAEDLPRLYGSSGDLLDTVVAMVMTLLDRIGDEPDPEVTIDASYASGVLTVRLSSTGKPLPVQLRGDVLDTFLHVHASDANVGFGLWLAEEACSRLGGSLAFGDGRRPEMVLRLPFALADEAGGGAVAPPPSGPPNVLIVDDDDIVRMALSAMLKGPIRLHSAASCEEAQQVLGRHEPGIILLDLVMPQEGGAAFYAWLERHRPELCERVVFVTGGAFTPEARNLLRRTQHPVILKPVHRDALSEVVERYLGEPLSVA